MNWLTPLCQEILAKKEFSRDQRDTLVLWAAELSGICETFAPKAPIPQLETFPTGQIQLSWYWNDKLRGLTLSVEENLRVALTLVDMDRSHVTVQPSHEQLKRAAQSFFEGWVPHG